MKISIRCLKMLALFVIAIAIIGCKQSNHAEDILEDQQTQRMLIAKMHRAWVKGDLDNFVECLVDGSEHRKLAESMLDTMAAGYEFRTNLEARFGDGIWDEYLETTSEKAQVSVKLPPSDFLWVETIELRIEDDATYYKDIVSDNYEFKLVNQNGNWQCDILHTVHNESAYAKMQKKLAKAIRGTIPYISDPNVDLVEIKEIMAKKMGY